MGLSMQDLEELDMGMVIDMFTEKGNDSVDYPQVAGQADFDRF